MSLEEELRWYLSTSYRRKQLMLLERMAARPTLSQRRAVRPRKGVLSRLWSWLKEAAKNA